MRFLLIIGVLILGVSCNSSERNTNKSLKQVAREIIKASKNCALITIDSTGAANARAMDPFLPNEDFSIYMATNPKSAKVKEIHQNSNATLYYFDAKAVSYVTLKGNATLVNSKAVKEKYWKKEWENFYKNRTTDYMLIKFIPYQASIISEKYKILGDSITWKTPQLNF